MDFDVSFNYQEPINDDIAKEFMDILKTENDIKELSNKLKNITLKNTKRKVFMKLLKKKNKMKEYEKYNEIIKNEKD
jgi:hypothetical protein